MKNLLYSLLAAATLCSCSQNPSSNETMVSNPKDTLQVYLCIGQSNMVGAARPESQDSVVPERFINLSAVDDVDRKRGEWRVAVPPLCRHSTGLCPVDYFGRTMLEHLPENVSVGVIHVAVDGTAIRIYDKDQCKGYCDSIQPDWMVNEINFYDRNPYARLIEMAKLAQQKGTIRGILLHQGCTDAYSDGWCRTVKKIYGDILSDLNLQAENVPLLVGETAGIDQQGVCQHANPTIDRIHDFIPTAWTISSRGCTVSDDHVHFAAEGYRLLGKRYGIRMLQLQGYDVADSTDCRLQTEVAASADSTRATDVDFSNPLERN